jgi:hypothetical protein
MAREPGRTKRQFVAIQMFRVLAGVRVGDKSRVFSTLMAEVKRRARPSLRHMGRAFSGKREHDRC